MKVLALILIAISLSGCAPLIAGTLLGAVIESNNPYRGPYYNHPYPGVYDPYYNPYSPSHCNIRGVCVYY